MGFAGEGGSGGMLFLGEFSDVNPSGYLFHGGLVYRFNIQRSASDDGDVWSLGWLIRLGGVGGNRISVTTISGVNEHPMCSSVVAFSSMISSPA